jgi:hypothetical protein
VDYGADREVHAPAGQEAGATRSASGLESSASGLESSRSKMGEFVDQFLAAIKERFLHLQ